ncbi:MAG: protein kinase [Cyanobacteria bacterium]|jgi:serine/threonine-protein kinase|nr:protein kinase [Cyanobacteria bacterium GSL.Bin21]
MSQPKVKSDEIPFGTLINDRYLIQKVLGQGGLGRTYLTLDTHRFNEPCVLKEFAPSGTGEYELEKSRDLFRREAKILHQIKHPQIPKFLACFEGRDQLFLVQEYVDGKTYSELLEERQKKGQSFSETEIIQWLKSLLLILDYIHECGIIHRDISPDNVMLPNDHDLPLLIDFGVGKQVINPDQLNLKEDDHSDAGSFVGKMSFVGKIGYAPREQISMGRCSPSCDLYALGVTAVVLLTGKNPTLLLDQYSLEWRWHSYCQVSDSFTQILDQLLADQPQHRYQVAKEVLADLQQLEQPEATIISHPTHPPEAEPEPEPLPAKSETTIISSSSSMRPQEVEIELSSSDSLDSEFVERCQRELAVSIGPIASFIIDDVIAQSSPHSPHELVEALAAEIPDLREAREFKHRVFS